MMSRSRGIRTLVCCCCLSASLSGSRPTAAADGSELERLFNEGFELLQAGTPGAALVPALECWRRQRAVLDPGDPGGALCATLLGLIYRQTGDLETAREHSEIVLRHLEGSLGDDHPMTVDSRSGLAGLLLQMGEIEPAIELYHSVIASLEPRLGPDDPNTLANISLLGMALRAAGRPAEALPYARRTLASSLKVLGPDDEQTAFQHHLLAGLLHDIGEWEEAKTEFERALMIREAVLGPSHPTTGATLNDFGILLGDIGRLSEARVVLERSLRIADGHPDTDPTNLGKSYDNLATLTRQLGDYETARTLGERAVSLLDAVDSQGVDTAIARANLANVLQGQDELEAARDLFERALPILLAQSNQTMAANALGSLSANAWLRDDLEQARALAQRSLAAHESSHGRDHPDTAGAIQNLATLLIDLGRLTEAEALFQEALAIQARAGSVLERVTLGNLALLSHRQGRGDDTLDYLERALEAEERLLIDVLATGSEQEKQLFIERDRSTGNWAVQHHVLDAPEDPRALRLAFTSVLRRKGRALDASAAGRAALRRRMTAEAQDLLDRLTDLRRRRSTMLGAAESSAGRARAKARRELEAIEQEIKSLAGDLSEAAPTLAADRPITAEGIRDRLPTGTALVEIATYWPHSPTAQVRQRHGERRYVAYIARPDRPLRFADLGPADPIDEAAGRFREALAGGRADAIEVGQALDALTFARIRPHLTGVHRLVLAPDGALNLTPFAALPDFEGRYLIERFELSWVTSGRDLSTSLPESSSEPPLLVGDPDFGTPSPEAAPTGLLGKLAFGPLPATRLEVMALADLLDVGPERALTGDLATEEALRRLRSPRLLHLATHGFFVGEIRPEPPPTPGAARAFRTRSTDSLQASGLALAGFNSRRAGPENDGVLDALEVIDLDLRGTEIVALSACETGLGEVRDGEGVFGLRRALVLAGSRSQLMTLWQVADEATKNLMLAWYEQVLAGVGRAAALRAVQLAALHGESLPALGQPLTRGSRSLESTPDTDPRLAGGRHPFYWAGFILSGEAGPLADD